MLRWPRRRDVKEKDQKLAWSHRQRQEGKRSEKSARRSTRVSSRASDAAQSWKNESLGRIRFLLLELGEATRSPATQWCHLCSICLLLSRTSRNIFWVLLTLELFRLCAAKNVPSPAWLSSKQDRTCCRKPTGMSSMARKPSQPILARRTWEQLSRLCLLDHPTPGLVEMLRNGTAANAAPRSTAFFQFAAWRCWSLRRNVCERER